MIIDDGLISNILSSVRSVGDFAYSSQSSIREIKYKGIKNPQTNVDIEAENLLREQLSKLIPDAGYIVEEGETNQRAECNFTIDAIDGTKFFSTQFPCFFTQIALIQGDKTVLSAIYNPVSKQMFHAVLDKGTYLNNKRVFIPTESDLSKCIANVEVGKIESVALDFISKLGPVFNRFWLVPAVFVPYMTTDTIQVYMRYHSSSNSAYDLEPRWLIIKEGGGVVHEHIYNGRKLYIAAHPTLAAEIESVLGILPG